MRIMALTQACRRGIPRFLKTGHLKHWRLAMILPDEDSFVQRSDTDGTADSNCKRGYKAVCTSLWKAKPAFEEHNHVCETAALGHWLRATNRGQLPTDVPWRALRLLDTTVEQFLLLGCEPSLKQLERMIRKILPGRFGLQLDHPQREIRSLL
jgi:hypothetical protein